MAVGNAQDIHQMDVIPRRGFERSRYVLIALLMSVAILTLRRDVFWRPFDDRAQESLASLHAYGFAAANEAGLCPNPILSRDIDIEQSRVRPYTHWPNGMFLVFEGVLRLFGRTEAVGRSFAVALSVSGFALILAAFSRQSLLIWMALPLILLTGAGQDSAPFLFVDTALSIEIGILMWMAEHRPHHDILFRAAMLACLLFNQLIVPFAVVIVALRSIEHRSSRSALTELALLAAGSIAVTLALAGGYSQIGLGLAELQRIAVLRSQHTWLEWAGMLDDELRRLLMLGRMSGVIVAAAWLVVVWRRNWQVAILIPSFLLYALLLRQYIAVHQFARLPFVFFSLVTCLAAAELILKRWRLGGAAVAIIIALLASRSPRRYMPDPAIQATRAALFRLQGDPAQAAVLQRCNAFQLRSDQPGFSLDDRIGQFFFGVQVVDRVRTQAPVRACVIDVGRETVRGL